MGEFLTLVGQLFVIAVVQNVLEMFIELSGKAHLTKLLSVACYVGGLYLVVAFVFDNVMPEVTTIFNVGF